MHGTERLTSLLKATISLQHEPKCQTLQLMRQPSKQAPSPHTNPVLINLQHSVTSVILLTTLMALSSQHSRDAFL
jgi:hypothetical protein